MRNLTILLFILISAVISSYSQSPDIIVTSDIDLFWKAYDKIIATDNEAERIRILESEYINPGSPGLKSIIRKRGYTAQDYISAIRKSPSFWNSIRNNTQKAPTYAREILLQIQNLKALYPDLRPASIYFTIGAMMTGGSAYEGHVLIGAELAMADSSAVTEGIQPDYLRENLTHYFKTNPIDDIVLLNVHEYVHTQQGDYGKDLLSMSLYEGIAEFVSVLAAETPSASPAISYGQQHLTRVRARFQKEMFSPHWNDWLYNNLQNEFGIRDLGYFVGYAIAESYYDAAINKSEAVKDMIELDCTNSAVVKGFLEKSAFLTSPYDLLKLEYEEQKPSVIGLQEFSNGAKNVNASTTTITVLFSKEMNPRFRNFKLGTRREKYLLPVLSAGWSDDHKAFTLETKLEPGRRYQIVVDSQFRDVEGRPISKYSIDFETAKH